MTFKDELVKNTTKAILEQNKEQLARLKQNITDFSLEGKISYMVGETNRNGRTGNFYESEWKEEYKSILEEEKLKVEYKKTLFGKKIIISWG